MYRIILKYPRDNISLGERGMIVHTQDEMVSLLNIKGGAAIELFDIELKNVLFNILDPNTKPDALREIILKVKIKPDEDRFISQVTVECSSKLSSMSALSTQIVIDRQGGVIEARELLQTQKNLFEDSDKVTPIRKED